MISDLPYSESDLKEVLPAIEVKLDKYPEDHKDYVMLFEYLEEGLRPLIGGDLYSDKYIHKIVAACNGVSVKSLMNASNYESIMSTHIKALYGSMISAVQQKLDLSHKEASALIYIMITMGGELV